MEANQKSLDRALIKSLSFSEVVRHPVFCCHYRDKGLFTEVLLLADGIIDPDARKHALRQMSIWHGIKLENLQELVRFQK